MASLLSATTAAAQAEQEAEFDALDEEYQAADTDPVPVEPAALGPGPGPGGARFKAPEKKDWQPKPLKRQRRYSLEPTYSREQWSTLAAPRRKIWLTFEEPGYSPAALVVNMSITLLIVVAITAFIAESSVDYYGRDVAPFPQVEFLCTVVFTAEVVLRAFACPDLKAFAKNSWNIADLIAILPWYIEKLAQMGSSGVPQQRGGFAVVRVVRLVRLLKLVRYGQRNKKMGGMLTVFRETMQESSSNLKMMIMFELLTMVICGAVVYYIERGAFHYAPKCSQALTSSECGSTSGECAACLQRAGDTGWCEWREPTGGDPYCGSMSPLMCDGVDRQGDNCGVRELLDKKWYFQKTVRKTVGWGRGEPGRTVGEAIARSGEEVVTKETMFETIFSGMYWTLVTVTGVGYGDMVPSSVVGKVATFITILAGLLLIALPVSVIGGNFQACYMRLIDSEARLQSHSTAAAAAFQMSGLRFRLRAHRNGVEALREAHPLQDGEFSVEAFAGSRRAASKVRRASAQIADFGEKVADSPAKRKDAKAITLAGVRTVNELAKRLAPSDVCASLYMEHLLRALQVADDHFASAMADCVTEQFVGVLEHTHKHVMANVEGYEEESKIWSADSWAATGKGLPEGYHFQRAAKRARAAETSDGSTTQGAPEPEPEAEPAAAVSAQTVEAMTADELDAHVDDILGDRTPDESRAPREP